MKTPICITEAVQRLWDIAKANPIPGLNPYKQRDFDSGALPSQILGDGFDLSWERGWGIDAKLRVYSVVESRKPVLRVEVGWSSSSYGASAANVAADLHSRVADLACWMQAVVDSLPPLTPAER